MPSSHSLDRIAVTFDDENLVANAGLLAPATLAERLGFRELLDETVDLGDVAGRANVGAKAMTVIHSVLAGADSINDCDVLRAGVTSTVLGHAVAAPSTIGTFLRAFSWAHTRQLDSVSKVMLARAWAAGAGPEDRDAPFTIDLDSSVHETYGLQKEGGTRFSYNQVRGYHRLYATAADTGEVLHARLRGGNSHTARGAVSFLAETFSRVRAAGVAGPLRLRADSGFYSKKVVDACQKAKVGFSITVKLYKSLLGAISQIPEDQWQPIPYWLDDGADVAVIDWQAFASKGKGGVACRLVVRRVKPTPGSQLALIATYSYHAFITDLPGDAVTLDFSSHPRGVLLVGSGTHGAVWDTPVRGACTSHSRGDYLLHGGRALELVGRSAGAGREPSGRSAVVCRARRRRGFCSRSGGQVPGAFR
jgi:hypothetical protein